MHFIIENHNRVKIMDMKASISLSNARDTAQKTTAPLKENNNSRSDSADFDRQLAQQIEQTEADGTPQETHKNKENQQANDEYEAQEHTDAELESDHINTRFMVDNGLIAVGKGVSDGAAEEVEQPLLTLPEGEQLMPLAGNALPLAIQAENEVSKDRAIQFNAQNNPNLTSAQPYKQPNLAEVLAENTQDKPVVAEFKTEVKAQQGNNNPSSRAELNMASLSAAMASAQQYVPQTSSAAVINMQSATAVNGFTNPLPVSSGIAAAVQSPNWSQGLTERVSWMMQGNIQVAELKLNPAHLGPLEVKLTIQDDKASIVFVASHAQVKEAIDTAMPRLREMLEQQGLSLDDVDVSQYSDAKEDQANNESADIDESLNAEQGMAASTQSLINIDVSQGLSIYV